MPIADSGNQRNGIDRLHDTDVLLVAEFTHERAGSEIT
jgi:hypothetical protein